MDRLPDYFFWIVGVLIMFNLGAIGSVIMVSFRATWFISKLDSRVEHIEESHKKDIDAAFDKIRLLMNTRGGNDYAEKEASNKPSA